MESTADSCMADQSGERTIRPGYLGGFFASPYGLAKLVMFAVTEVKERTVKVKRISVTQVSAVRVGGRRMLAIPRPRAAEMGERRPTSANCTPCLSRLISCSNLLERNNVTTTVKARMIKASRMMNGVSA